jgi:hypothetical protein
MVTSSQGPLKPTVMKQLATFTKKAAKKLKMSTATAKKEEVVTTTSPVMLLSSGDHCTKATHDATAPSTVLLSNSNSKVAGEITTKTTHNNSYNDSCIIIGDCNDDDDTKTVDETPPCSPPRLIKIGGLEEVTPLQSDQVCSNADSDDVQQADEEGEEDEELKEEYVVRFYPAAKEEQELGVNEPKVVGVSSSSKYVLLLCSVLLLLLSPVVYYNCIVESKPIQAFFLKGLGEACTLNEQCQSGHCFTMPPLPPPMLQLQQQESICACQVCTTSGCGGCGLGERCVAAVGGDNNFHTATTNVCQALGQVGEVCQSHDDCDSQACGYATAAYGVSKKTCCASGQVSSTSSYVMGYEYCTDMEEGATCWYSSDCAQGLYCHTTRSWWKGTCTPRRETAAVGKSLV